MKISRDLATGFIFAGTLIASVFITISFHAVRIADYLTKG